MTEPARNRLLIAANSFDSVGGVETSLLSWLGEVHARGWQVDAVLARVLGSASSLLCDRGVPVTFIRLYWLVRGVAFPNPFGVLHLAWRLRLGRYDAILGLQPPTHYFLRYALLLARALGGRRPRVVVMEHLTYRNRSWGFVLSDRLLRGLTDCHVCVSTHLRGELLQRSRLPERKVIAIPHGVRLPEPGSPDPELASRIQGRLVIGCVARISPVKRQRFLIDCLEQVERSTGVRPLLVLAGENTDDPGLSADLRDRGLEDSVWLLGHRKEIHRIYRLFDIFVLPSVLEGFGIAWAEAMAHAIPVVTTRIPPMTEFIRDGVNGLLFDPDDAEGLIRCLTSLIKSPELRGTLGREGRALVASALREEDQRQKYVDAFLGASPEIP